MTSKGLGMRGRPVRALICCAVLLGAAVPSSAAEAVNQSCTTDTSPPTYWLSKTLSQSVTPTSGTISKYEVRLYFAKAYSGPVSSRLMLHPPIEPTEAPLGARGITLSSRSVTVSATKGASAWVSFAVAAPTPPPSQPGGTPPLYEIEIDVGTRGFGWLQCKTSYPRGRAYARPDIDLEVTTVSNEALHLTLPADLQFRLYTK